MINQLPRVTVIIPAFNSESSLQYCLSALQDQTVPADCFEVIVVDDGSTDGTRNLANLYPHVHFHFISHQGPAAARNFGVQNSVGDIVLFTDADCVPNRDWIEKMIAPFEQEWVVGVKGAYSSGQRSLVARFVQAEYESKYDHMRREKYIDFIDTYSAGYRKDLFLQNGGFNIEFPTSCVEDQEFSFRMARAGHKMVFVPDAQVVHSGHANSLKDYFLKKYKIGYWKVLVHQRHPDKLIHDSHTPPVLKIQIIILSATIPFFLLGFVLPSFFWLSVLFGFLFVLTTLPFISRNWRKDFWVSVISPLLILIRAFALGLGFGIGSLSILLKPVNRAGLTHTSNIRK